MERDTNNAPRIAKVGGRPMTRNRAIIHGLATANADALVGRQAEAARATAKQFLLRKRGLEKFEADEVAAMVAEQFLGKPSFWIETYGCAEKFAYAVTNSRYADWLGIDRKQRGEGRTLVRDAEGNLQKRRMAFGIEIENEDGETEIRPVCSDRDDFVEDVITRVDIEHVLVAVSDDQVAAIDAVVLQGHKAVEVGADTNVAHTTIKRRIDAGTKRLREALGEDYEFATE